MDLAQPRRQPGVVFVGGEADAAESLSRLLAAHPAVVAVPQESSLFATGLLSLRDRFHHGAVSSPMTGRMYSDRGEMVAGLRKLADFVYTEVARRQGTHAAWILETLAPDVDNLEVISEIVENARVIHVRGANDRTQRADSQLAREVDHESLNETPCEVLERLCAWLGLPWTDEIGQSIAEELRAGSPPIGSKQRPYDVANDPVIVPFWRAVGELADVAVEALERSCIEPIASVAKPDARIVIESDRRVEARGDQGLRALADELETTRGQRRRQARADMYGHRDGFTVVASYHGESGVLSHYLLLAEGDVQRPPPISSLQMYELPSNQASS